MSPFVKLFQTSLGALCRGPSIKDVRKGGGGSVKSGRGGGGLGEMQTSATFCRFSTKSADKGKGTEICGRPLWTAPRLDLLPCVSLQLRGFSGFRVDNKTGFA